MASYYVLIVGFLFIPAISLLIIVGIFLSIVIAFNVGLIVQWFVRLAFSFNQGSKRIDADLARNAGTH
jgi:hypothetical protein